MSSTGDGAVGVGPGRREQLLTAARQVLAQHGYERTTVSSIATKASVAQGTFYLYFPSKEALPGAIAEQLCLAMGEVATDAASDSTFDAAVESLVFGSFEVADSFSDVLLIANRGIELCEDWAGWLQVTASWRDGIEQFLTRFQRSGDVDGSLDVTTTTYLVRDLLDRAAKARVLFNQTGYADATVKLLRRALAPA
jgi:AcrR family transcriptional regulator